MAAVNCHATTPTTQTEKKKKKRGAKRHRTSPTPPQPPQSPSPMTTNKRMTAVNRWLQCAYRELVKRCYGVTGKGKDWLEASLLNGVYSQIAPTVLGDNYDDRDRSHNDGGGDCFVPGCDSHEQVRMYIELRSPHPTEHWWISFSRFGLPAYGIPNTACNVCAAHIKAAVDTFNLEHLPLIRFTSTRAKQTLDETCHIPRVIIQLICAYYYYHDC
jgi:hypothetical protein